MLRKLLILLCVAGIGISGWNLWQIYTTYETGKDLYAELSQLAVQEESRPLEREALSGDAPSVSAETEEDGRGESGEETVALDITVDFETLQEINPDTVGWIYCPDTVISYPVVHGTDNEYYLDHLLDGQSNSSGTVFVDCQNQGDLSDDNTVLYGHHMKNGSMFAALEGYRSQDFYETHQILFYLTPEQSYALYPFFGGVTSANDEVYTLRFSSGEERERWIARQQNRSDFQSQVQINSGDQLITLSTCAYDFDNARYVVIAKAVPLS